MRALKSDLAKHLLANKETADELRRAVEFAVSSHARKNSTPTVSYKDDRGQEKQLQVRVVSAAM